MKWENVHQASLWLRFEILFLWMTQRIIVQYMGEATAKRGSCKILIITVSPYKMDSAVACFCNCWKESTGESSKQYMICKPPNV